MIPIVFGVVALSFFLFHVVGGSPASNILGKNATVQALDEFDAQQGYDLPLFWGGWKSTRLASTLGSGEQTLDPGAETPVQPEYPLPRDALRITLLARARQNSARLLIQAREQTHEITLTDRWSPVAVEFEPDAGNGDDTIVVRADGDGAVWQNMAIARKNEHPWQSRFLRYLGLLLKGDMGISIETNRRVADILLDGVGPSLALTIPILTGNLALAVTLALLCAWRRNGLFDRLCVVAATALMSVNYIVWIVAGQYLLAYRLGWFPIWGFESATYIALPVLIGIVTSLGRDVRFYRAMMLEEMQKDYVKTARAKGVGPGGILFRHVLKNALPPIITNVSLSLPFLFTGSLLLESFFGIPGLGGISVNAIYSSDMAVVQAVVLIGALLYVVINLLTDLCYAWVDPRVRLQ